MVGRLSIQFNSINSLKKPFYGTFYIQYVQKYMYIINVSCEIDYSSNGPLPLPNMR